MALVVFLRGVNVGGARVFRPKLLADGLAHLGCVNVGAAGTFVVREKITETKLRDTFHQALPFETKVMICRDAELQQLVELDPFGRAPKDKRLRRFCSVLLARPKQVPRLPWLEPDPGPTRWRVKTIGVHGRLAVGWWRTLDGVHFPDVNQVMETGLGVSSTTRNWNTIVKISEILRAT